MHALQTVEILEPIQREEVLPNVLKALYNSRDQANYESTKFIINTIFNLNKIPIDLKNMAIIDDFLVSRLRANEELVK